MKELSKTPTVVRELVGEDAAAQRIDNFLLRRCKGVPKSHIYRIVRSGQVRVNGRRVEPDHRLQYGDEVRIPPLRVGPSIPSASAPPGSAQLDVLFEDEALVALNKPAGMAVHGGSGVSYGVIELMRRQRPGSRFLELVHRLDRETSGVLLVAKQRPALVALHDLLRQGAVEKRYLALVKGSWQQPALEIRLPLHKYVTEAGERRVVVRPDGKEARSLIEPRRRWAGFSLLEVELKTGRTHQIRVHLAHLGFPLCGDEKYGDFVLNRRLRRSGLTRMFLHAQSVAFRHPTTGKPVELHAPLAGELSAFLERLDASGGLDHGTAL
jgi:23S rRNA pseudouridine955/2504/2580 synthase